MKTNFEHFIYLITIFIFAGSAVLIEWAFGFRKVKKFLKVISLVVIICLLYSIIADPVAVKWKIWQYSSSKTFGIFIFGGMAIETLLYVIFCSVAISTPTLFWGSFEEKNEPIRRKTWEEVKKTWEEIKRKVCT